MANPSVTLTFDASTYPDPEARIAAWRDAFSLSVDVHFEEREIENFTSSVSFHSLGPVLLADTRYTSHTVVRSRETIARTGGEQVILDLFSEGGFAGVVGGQNIHVEPGDCFIMDMRGTFQINLRAGRFIAVIMPRRLLEEVAGRSTKLHGLVLSSQSAQAGFLRPMLIGLVEQAGRLGAKSTHMLGAAIIAVIAASIEGVLETPEAVPLRSKPAFRKAASTPTASFARLRRHIDRHAADPAFNPEALAVAFGLSRATLYRLFRLEGGVAEAIRRRRAAAALQALTQSKTKPLSLASIAQASGFQDVAAMRRALRAIYGASPARLQKTPIEVGRGPGPGSLAIGALFDELPS